MAEIYEMKVLGVFSVRISDAEQCLSHFGTCTVVSAQAVIKAHR